MSELWRVNGVELAVDAAGDGPVVLLVHGFPDLGITWHRQVPTLVEAGYRVLVPDLRGYGDSSRPAGRSSYAASEIGRDLIGLLDHEGVDRAHVVGHDWGAQCVWALGLDHPDRLLSLTGLSVPHTRPAPAPPIEILRRRLGEEFYQVRFQAEGVAEQALERDVAATLAAAFDDDFEAIGRPVGPRDRPAWMSAELFDHLVAVFRRTGFAGGLSYYRNIDDNWRAASARDLDRIEAPSLFLTGSTDPVAAFMRVDESLFADLRVVVVEGAGHWVHQQAPDRVGAALLEHLRRADELAA
ncbi:alpha/beta fold hydrolase [Nocardioides nitrophenolicus]|uniref:alpha/beta fold hydrolase n=1 Tax=Nocardioides nitrophenolicus TaxID=60489 RepID=UPI001956D546|nr:alpha/beta hydrolase [Nocardioides nitrophenolicus]MBM7520048.1 pimeloyl-ACP methyl ester carboxylesterase [Nocardioides nitrophenolicus]